MTNCIICESADTRRLQHKSRNGNMLKLVACNRCGHWFQPPESHKDIYTTGEFTKIARKNETTPSAEKIRQLDNMAFYRYNYFYPYIKDFNNILEVGSSMGSFVHMLKLMNKDAEGLEPDSYYCNYSETQYGFRQKNLLLEEFAPSQRYDAVVSFHVIEHVKDPKVFFDKIHSLLNDNGKILIECPSLEVHSYGSMVKTIWEPHFHYFTLASMYHLASQRFKVVKIGFYGIALFLYAEKSGGKTYDEKTFNRLKEKSRRVKALCKYFPAVPLVKTKVPLKQLILQSLLQRDTRAQFKKFTQLSAFAIRERAYVAKETRGRTHKPRFTHISYYRGWANAGDTVLSKCVRDVFNQAGKISWNLKSLKLRVDGGLINEMNKSAMVIVGGGGLLIPDSNPNESSGWQWAIEETQLRQIQSPVVVYAIGYNFFKGQQVTDFFVSNLRKLLDKTAFFSLRNQGSIKKVVELAGKEYAAKIRYQPCPSTLIRKLYPWIPPKQRSRNIAVNVAFDRYERRYGSRIHHILHEIARAIKNLSGMGYQIYNVCHVNDDAKFTVVLESLGVPYKNVNLQYALPNEVFDFYNNMELAIGTRGHAQMIPFGLNCKILSLSSHNKLRWFLEDIKAVDWLVDLHEEKNIADHILQKSESILNDASVETQLMEKQASLYNISLENRNEILNLL